MTVNTHAFERQRRQLLSAAVKALEGALPPGTPARVGEGRAIWDVVAGHLRVDEVRAALRSVGSGPGGELTPTAAGNVAMCSAESSALMAVNFLAPFAARGGLLARPAGSLVFERELRVAGVRAPVGPTLDAVLASAAGTLAVEAKTAEPWRGPPKVAISAQYEEPAGRVSAKTRQTLVALRDGSVRYRCLDAAQLIKHLLGVHSALGSGALPGPATLVMLYWRPSDPGGHAGLFDAFEAEVGDFAARVDDQPVAIVGLSTARLLGDWTAPDQPAWLMAHAAGLRARYDVQLQAEESTAHAVRTFGDWSQRWLALARYTGREVPDLDERVQRVCAHWRAEIPPGWERPLDARLIDPRRRYLRVHLSGQPKPGSEHELEHEILAPDPAEVRTHCLGGQLVDGINAVPLTRAATGYRANNVEADMLLLIAEADGHRLLLVEAKTASDNAFYAAVENLRQLRLFTASPAARRIFQERHPHLAHPLPVTGVVLGPRSFLVARGAKERAVQPAQQLLDAIKAAFGIDACLATWDPATRSVSAWPSAQDPPRRSASQRAPERRPDLPARPQLLGCTQCSRRTNTGGGEGENG